ncbi:MAG: RNA methyltransferase [Anaerolineales bacterium]
MITSSQNPKLKLARALQGRARERYERGAFLAEGVRLVEEAANGNWEFHFVLYDETLSERGKWLIESLRARGVECEEVLPGLMQSLSDTNASQGLLAVLRYSLLPIPTSLNFLLIPDQIRDPGNLGTLLRAAWAASVQAVFLPPETTDAFAPKVVRAGMGAHFHLPIQAMDWATITRICHAENLQVFLADMNGRACWETDFRTPLALVVGGEAGGASRAARSLATDRVGIPMPGGTESLNAGVAGAIVMFEVVRQRQQNAG